MSTLPHPARKVHARRALDGSSTIACKYFPRLSGGPRILHRFFGTAPTKPLHFRIGSLKRF